MEDVSQNHIITVTRKWYPEGDLAVIYKMDNYMVFYSTDEDPLFHQGQVISEETYFESRPYKCIPYYPGNLPRMNRNKIGF